MEWRRRPAVRLPMLGTVDSLNVSAAAAVLFYEALRQRTSVERNLFRLPGKHKATE